MSRTESGGATGPSKSRRVRLSQGGKDLLWTSWEDVEIVFQPASCETHVFNPTTSLILEVLRERSATTDEIRDALGAMLGQTGELPEIGPIDAALGRLDELGLVELTDEPRRHE